MSSWVKILNEKLKIPKSNSGLICVDLFSGCGGLGLGFEATGFKTFGYERDVSAYNTYKENLHECYNVELSEDINFNNIDILIGGPPCQPFSVRGNQKGPKDNRDGFPIMFNVARKYEPKIILIENVRGLIYKNKEYFNKIISKFESLGYEVTYKLLNASDFSVPQNRERIFIIATKVGWDWPSLKLNEKITVGDAIGDTMYDFDEKSDFLTPSMDKYIFNYEKKSKCIKPRDLYFDKPSRTLTCRNLGGQTSDMIRVKLNNGKRRRITHREAARLQSFPDWYVFTGNKYKIFEQIGNSVPPLMAYELAKECLNKIYKPTNTINDFSASQLEINYV